MAQTRSRSRLWAVVPLAFFLFASWQAVATLSRTPAFNRSFQVETAQGGGVLGYARVMYRRADYQFWVSRGWQARAFGGGLPGAAGSAEREAAFQDSIARVRDGAIESLRHSPGDPGGWMLLAEAELALGNVPGALEAWQTSQAFSPYLFLLAKRRLDFLIGLMSAPETRDLALSEVAPETVQADLDTIRLSIGMRWLAERYTQRPELAAFLGNAAVE